MIAGAAECGERSRVSARAQPPRAQPPLLQATELAVGRDRRALLSGLTFDIGAGERWALVGPNGSGKSTLLRTLAGLLPPVLGALLHRGRSLPRGSARVAEVGVLLQEESPAPFTVEQLVVLGLALNGPPASAQAARVRRALGAADLEGLATRPCRQLSGGESQRARLARSTVALPGLLLLDEPTNHLDPARRVQLLEQLSRLGSEAALVLCTHDLSLAASCSHAVVLGAVESGFGRVVALGESREVLTEARLSAAFGVRVQRVEDEETGVPWFRVREPSLSRGGPRVGTGGIS